MNAEKTIGKIQGRDIHSMDQELFNVKTFLTQEEIWFKENYDIKYDTYFKSGGLVKLFICPQTRGKMKKIIEKLIKSKITYKVIGFTSNVLLFDQIEYSIIVSTKNLTCITKSDGIVEVDSGYSLQDFVRIAVLEEANGFEGLEGIPGSIGGGVCMNAGAYGYAISQNIISVDCIDESGKAITLTKEECGFSHRKSLFQSRDLIILCARFKFFKGNAKKIADNIETFHIARHSYQEFVYPNLGSMFSISGDPYGALLKHEGRVERVIYYIFKLLYKNPAVKFINRKKPRNTAMNNLFLDRFKHTQYTPSNKSLNILINDGKTPVESHLKYIMEFEKRLGDRFSIENEMIIGPAYRVDNGFKSNHEKIISYLSSKAKFNNK
jgi:UDP-N-acetylmuramate dehydrogenase